MVKIAAPRLIEVTKVKVHPNNVKEHPEKQINNLIQLIKWVGFKDPIVLDKDFNCKAGHGRLLAAQKLGMKEVPYVSLEGLTKKQMDLFIYMDNQINESPWIKENVQLLLEEIPMQDLELFDINWDGVRDPSVKEESDPIPKPPKVAKSKLGQLYQLGDHRIICGDATDPEVLKKLFGEKKASIGFTSPPYNMGDNAKLGTIGSAIQKTSKYQDNKDDIEDYPGFLKKFTDLCLEYSKYFFLNVQQLATNKKDLIDYLHTYRDHFVDTIVWDKQNGPPYGLESGVLNTQFEYIYILTGTKNPTRRIKSANFKGTLGNVYRAPKQSENEYADIHNATFPAHLPRYIIKNFSKPHDIILEQFLGTGTTLIAAEQLSRICYGIELDPVYLDVIIERWENYTGEKVNLL